MGGRYGQTIGVLFTDIARSTELMFSLGPDRFEGVRRRHMDHLRELAEHHGGREVKNLGDGLMLVLPSAADTVAVAVAAQQRTSSQARAAGIDLQIRIGASVGDTVEDRGDHHGPAVVEAARLCAMADAGQVLAPALVATLAGDRVPGARFTALGSRPLKGIPEPVEIVEIGWEPTADHGLRLPAALSGAGRYGLIGRDHERDMARAAWRAAAGGTRQVLLLAGEPGVGKSRLASDVAQEVHAHGALVLLGRCDPEGAGPFQPFVLALRQYLDLVPADAVPVLGPGMAVLARVLPELTERLPDLAAAPGSVDPAVERLLLFDAIADALHHASATSPLLLVLEDLHWAAPETIQLLRHVVGWPREAPVLVLTTHRSTELGEDSPLATFVAEMGRSDRCRRIDLHGLDDDGVAALVVAASNDEVRLDDDVRRFASVLHRATGGNPLYTTQVLAHLVDTGVIRREGGRWRAPVTFARDNVPTSVHDVIVQRISAAGRPVRRLLELAAVAGDPFDPVLVEHIDDLDGEFAEILHAATRGGFLDVVARERTEHRFVHALVRDTVYGDISPVRRAKLHAAIADHLERNGPVWRSRHASVLANHCTRAAVLGADRAAQAVAAARDAGDQAMIALDHVAAGTWYRAALRALELVPEADPADHVAVLVALGEAQRCAADPAYRETLLDAGERAHRLGRVELVVAAALANHRGTFADSRGRDDQRIAALRRALAVVGGTDPPSRARLLATLATELTVGPGLRERVRLSNEAVALARRVGDARTLAWVLSARQSATVHLTTVEDRAETTAELVRLAGEVADPLLEFRAAIYGFRTGLEQGDATRIDAELARVRESAERLRQPEAAQYAMRCHSTQLMLVGRFDQAEECCKESIAMGEAHGIPDAGTTGRSQIFTIRLLGGRLASLVDSVRAQRSRSDSRVMADDRDNGGGEAADREPDGRVPLMASVRAGWALVLAETGDAAAAASVLAEQHDIDFFDYPLGHTAVPGIAAASLAGALVGDTELAVRLLPVLDTAGGWCLADLPYWLGPVDHHRGVLRALLGELDAAIEHLRAAVDQNRQLNASPFLARTLSELALALRRRRGPGDDGAAAAAVAEATALAARLGLEHVAPLAAAQAT